jgi:DNA-binding MarR family transcriptional regulator
MKSPPAAKLDRKQKLSTPVTPETDDGLVRELRDIVGYLLRASHGCYQNYWAMKFRDSETPITPVQGGMLIVIGQNQGLTQTALAKMMNVEGPTLMQSIDRLEKNGYIRRARFLDDRRSYALLLTARGREVLQEAVAFMPVRDDALLADLNPEERRNLADYLQRIIKRSNVVSNEFAELAAPDEEAKPAKSRKTAAKSGGRPPRSLRSA